MTTTGPWGSESKISTHLHGSASLPEFDGYANDVTPVGFYKDYHYPNFQPARTLWYHDHGVHWTAQQAYGGLAAMYAMHDPTERALLPQGRYDVPLMVNDAMFEADGRLAYDDHSHSGLWGDVVLVNGRPWPTMKVQRRTYRFRVLNCSISRSYNFRLSNGMPMVVVANDGGLSPQGTAVGSYRHAGAERYEIVIDFSKVPAGTRRVELLNGSNANNIDYDFTDKVMAFDLTDEPVDKSDPTWNRDYSGYTLTSAPIMTLPTSGKYKRRSFRVQRTDGIWSINGKSWLDVVDSGFRDVAANPGAGDTEIWEIENKSGGWFHPVHIHLIDFRVIGRRGGPGRVLPHENGPKDVVYVGENETVSLLIRFDVNPTTNGGHYMFHCHNLPHEDHDMMNQFSVGPDDIRATLHHPVLAAPPVPDPTYRA
jgi:FtsP/CotA-like multicopper oxidase with cupredoxin domain